MRAARMLLGGAIAVAVLAAAPSAGATNECRGLNPCVPVAGPWVVVPAGPDGAPPGKSSSSSPARAGSSSPGSMPSSATARSTSPSSVCPAARSVPGMTTSRSVVFVALVRRCRAPRPDLPSAHRLRARERRRRAADADRRRRRLPARASPPCDAWSPRASARPSASSRPAARASGSSAGIPHAAS